jgi:hypothetical protein
MRRPTSVDPVKESSGTSGCSTRAFPVSAPPWTTLKTPGGTPASARTCAKRVAEWGTSSAGFQTTAFPQRSAGRIFQEGTAIGKLKGVMRPATPIGRRNDIAHLRGSSDGTVCPKRWRPSVAA